MPINKFHFLIANIFIYVLFSIVITSNLVLAQEKNTSFFAFMERRCLDRPIYGYYDQTILMDKNIGISRIGIGFDGEINDTLVQGIDYLHSKMYRRTQFCNLSIGYKYYTNNKNESYPFVDFSLFKTSIFNELFGGFCISPFVNLFERRTTWYSKNNIEWINLGIPIGYDIVSSKNDFIFAPLVYIKFGLKTFKPDTLICINLDKQYRNYSYQWFDFGASLKTVFKYFSLDLTTNSEIGYKLNTTKTFAELAYTIWKDRNITNLDSTKQQYFLNTFKIYLSYNKELLEIEKYDDNDKRSLIYSIKIYIIRFGVSARLGKIDFFD
jgi:hypothetical protein